MDAKEYRRLCTSIDPGDIEQQYIRLPGDYHHWSSKGTKAKHAVLDAKVRLEEAEAQLAEMEALLYIKFREALAEPNSKGELKPPTEKTLNSAIITDEAYKEKQSAVFDVKRELADLQGEQAKYDKICRSIDHKKEMLISLGADRRALYQGDPMIRKANKENAEMG